MSLIFKERIANHIIKNNYSFNSKVLLAFRIADNIVKQYNKGDRIFYINVTSKNDYEIEIDNNKQIIGEY